MKKTFLWLEPSSLIQQMYSSSLAEILGDNWNIQFCSTSCEALSYFVESDVQFFACSWEIEGDTAIQLIQKIRKSPHFSRTPCILFTSNTNAFFRKTCLKIGVEYYLRKGAIGPVPFANLCHDILQQREEFKNETQESNPSNSPNDHLIYLADDSEINRKVTSKVLAKFGVRVQTANNGLELQSLVAQQAPDLIFCDIEMPKCDGLEASHNILDTNVQIPIIGLTGHGDPAMQKACAEAGMKEALCKPLKKDGLQKVLEKYLNLKF